MPPFSNSPKSDQRWRHLCYAIIVMTLTLGCLLVHADQQGKLTDATEFIGYNVLGIMLGLATVLAFFHNRSRDNEGNP